MPELIEPMQDDVIEEEQPYPIHQLSNEYLKNVSRMVVNKDDYKNQKSTFVEKFMKLPNPIRLCILYPLLYVLMGIEKFFSFVMIVQNKIEKSRNKKVQT